MLSTGMLPYFYQILRSYAPIVTLPIAIVIGAVGYTVESMISNRSTPSIESVEERRRRRQLEQGKVLISPEPVADIGKIVPKTILDRNLPPSLATAQD